MKANKKSGIGNGEGRRQKRGIEWWREQRENMVRKRGEKKADGSRGADRGSLHVIVLYAIVLGFYYYIPHHML